MKQPYLQRNYGTRKENIMALSQDLINQFVKLTDREEKPKEVTVNGTYKMINGEAESQILTFLFPSV